ncbi:hypothetical protein MBLNU459_g6270t1 [Dothideomycetes sp. NU459]
MVLESAHLDAKYNVLSINIISSNAIASRTLQVRKHLLTRDNASKAHVVCLRAKASVANKLISIIEIAKRDLTQGGNKIYQYSSLGSEIVKLKPSKKPASKINSTDDKHTKKDGLAEEGKEEDEGEEEEEEDDEEEAFQTMDEKAKIRNVPVLTVHLSTVPIKELREAHGEQAG